MLEMSLTALLRSRAPSRSANSSSRAFARVMLILGCLVFTTAQIDESKAAITTVEQINNYKLYAHNKIFDYTQFECYVQLINRESHWNPHVAPNHGHYGMVQGGSAYLIHKDAYQQIDWSITYIQHRYKSECKALQNSMRKGFY